MKWPGDSKYSISIASFCSKQLVQTLDVQHVGAAPVKGLLMILAVCDLANIARWQEWCLLSMGSVHAPTQRALGHIGPWHFVVV